MRQDDLGNKEMTVTVEQVVDMLTASIMAANESQMPPQVKECVVTTTLMLFEEHIDDILEYVSEKAKVEDVAKFFKGMCNN